MERSVSEPSQCYVEVRDRSGRQLFGLAIDYADAGLWPGQDDKSAVIEALKNALTALGNPDGPSSVLSR